MNLYLKKVIAIFLVLIILCTIHITCVALIFPLNGGVDTEITSVSTNDEVATTSLIDEVEHTEACTSETLVEVNTVIPETINDKTDKPAEVDKTNNPVPSDTTEYNGTSNIEDDLFYLAAAVCQEAGGSSEEIQMLVANVVVNRVNSPMYPDTIYDVLTQYMQYGTMWKYGISFPSWADDNVKNRCYDVAKRILDGERVCPENVVFQAEFVQGSGIYKQFDGFYFCYS